jgi:hypothetical protein
MRADAELSIGGFDKERVERTMEAVRAELGKEFAAVEEGARLASIDDIVAYELGIPATS